MPGLQCPAFSELNSRIERADHFGMGRVIVHLLDAAEAALAHDVAKHVVSSPADAACIKPQRGGSQRPHRQWRPSSVA